MPGANERIAANVRAYREQAGLSQAELAARVTAAGKQDGISWHQSTTARVEGGQQPLRLDEAQVLASVLGVTVERLMWATGEAAEVAIGEQAIGMLRRAWDDAATAIGVLHGAIAGARVTARSLARSESEKTATTLRALTGELGDATVRAAVTEGKARYEREATR